MNESKQQVEALFEAARKLNNPGQRQAFLEAACAGDLALRRCVEELLEAHRQADQFFTENPHANLALNPESEAEAGPAAKATMKIELTDIPDETVGQKIGRYKILEKVGEGGCGVVYVAEQTEPVKRRIALKVIKLGMDTKQVVARFEAERQALAMMDHSNIAKVLDAGTTETGRPYFIMELVRGIRITDYCDQNNLPTKERLDLFIKVCQAIQHAHQKGIIHRDIKPSNILVTLHDGVPVPKVIDFGIAKATEGRLTDATVYTQLHQFIGTPAYMSPEQAEMSGLDIDTRSDIYSLGVLLYELLTGKTPLDAQELLSQGIDMMRRTIREKAPPRPSLRLATLQGEELTTTAKRRSVEVPKLIHQLRGDLDWIVLKCLEKDRTRRYETANGLAMDIKRHLNTEPVVARPPSRWYEFQKTVRRHKFGFAATAAIIVVLAAGILVSTWQAVRAKVAERNALSAEAQATGERQKAEANEKKAAEAQASEAKQKAAAQQGLYNALVGQARATRLARQLGYRDRVFDLLEQAKALDVPQKNLADLRNEAVACLGDFVGLTPATFTNFPTGFKQGSFFSWALVSLAPSGKVAAFALQDGTIELLEMPSGKAAARLDGPGTNEDLSALAFNSAGDQLFALYVPKAENRAQYLQALPRHQLCSWVCDVNGRWRETANRVLSGAFDLFNEGTEVFAGIIEGNPANSGEPAGGCVNFRLFNLQTGGFVAGYNVTCVLTNVVLSSIAEAKTSDGGWIAVVTNSASSVGVTLYDWKTGRQINQLPTHGGLSLSPDGKYLASLSRAGGAIYTVPDFKRIGEFKEFFPFPQAVFSQSMVALPLIQQHRILLWNLAGRADFALLGEPEISFPAAFSSAGGSLLTAGDHYARFYRLSTPEKQNLPSHAAAVTAVAFSPDGRRLASVDKDRVVQVCDARTGRILWQTNGLSGPGQCLGYSPDGRWLATGDFVTDQIRIWDARTGKRLLQIGTNGAGVTYATQFSLDGRYLATAGGNGVRIYEIERLESTDGSAGWQAKLVKSASLPGVPEYFRVASSLRFSSDSRFLAFWSINGAARLRLWDFGQSAEPLRTTLPSNASVECESFTPDNHQLMALDTYGDIVMLEVPSGKELSSFRAETPEVARSLRATQLMSLSPDGSALALTSASGLGVDIWDPKTGKRLYSLPDEAGTVYWLAWSPHSRRLTIARDNGNIAIWNLDAVGHILTKLGLNLDGDRGRQNAEGRAMKKAMVGTGNPKAGTPGGDSLKAWLTALRQMVAANPADMEEAKHLATVYLWLGRTNEHQALCRKLLEQAAHSQDPAVHDRVAKAYLIQPHPDPELLKLAVASGRQALALSTSDEVNRSWFLITAGLADVRDGKPADAEPLLTEALMNSNGDPDQRGLALAYRAITYWQLGRTNDAWADFDALKKLALPLPPHDSFSPALLDVDHLAMCIAYEEARALLNAPRSPHP